MKNLLNGIQVGVCMLMTVTIIQLLKDSVKDIIGIIICLATFDLNYFAGVSIGVPVILSAILGIVIKVRYCLGLFGDCPPALTII